MKHFAACGALALLLGLYPAATALAEECRGSDRFAGMDANSDCRVSPEEFRAACPNLRDSAFGVIDANHDGAIDRPEWETFMKGHSSGASSGRTGGMPGMMPPAGHGGPHGPDATGASGQSGKTGGSPLLVTPPSAPAPSSGR